MRLLSLDFDPVYGDDATRSTFRSDVSVFDYDLVLWDPAATFKTYFHGYEDRYRGLVSFNDSTSVQLTSDVHRRRAEFAEYINSVRTLIVIAAPPQSCYVDTGQRTYSGTGRNRATTRHVTEFDLMTAVPAAGIQFVVASGDRISLHGDGPVTRLLRKYKDLLEYRAVILAMPRVLQSPMFRGRNGVLLRCNVKRTEGISYCCLISTYGTRMRVMRTRLRRMRTTPKTGQPVRLSSRKICLKLLGSLQMAAQRHVLPGWNNMQRWSRHACRTRLLPSKLGSKTHVPS